MFRTSRSKKLSQSGVHDQAKAQEHGTIHTFREICCELVPTSATFRLWLCDWIAKAPWFVDNGTDHDCLTLCLWSQSPFTINHPFAGTRQIAQANCFIRSTMDYDTCALAIFFAVAMLTWGSFMSSYFIVSFQIFIYTISEVFYVGIFWTHQIHQHRFLIMIDV